MADQSFTWSPGDYLMDTQGLSLAEHGAYFLLLMQLYVTGKPLPANAQQLHRICYANRGAERDATDRVIKRYFERTEEGWIQKRAMVEIEKRQNISKKRSKAALQKHSKSSANAEQMEFQSPVAELLDLSSSSLNQDSSLSLSPEDSLGQSVKKLQGKTLGALAFDAYLLGYTDRYGVAPVRNAKVNGQFTNLAKRLGHDAVAVAGFYPTHNAALYVRSGHAVDLLLRDCEKLRTEWATGTRMTDTKARQQDRSSTTADAARELIEESHARN